MEYETDAELEQAYIEAAERLHGRDGEVDIDADPQVSLADMGAWVQAWVWVDSSEVGL